MIITPFQHLSSASSASSASHPIDLAGDLRARLDQIKARISDSCLRSGRTASAVRLMAVCKTVSVEKVKAAIDEGVRLLGENRVQEAALKIPQLASVAREVGLEWHFIGHLQSNKARRAVELFHTIDSVDSFNLAERVDRAAAEMGRRMPILIEVNLGGEASKSGLTAEGLLGTVEKLASLSHIEVTGLMTVPPYLERAEEVRPYFRQLRELRDAASSIVGDGCRELSMGMSHDFEIAIEEGATLVRIGTALFGSRH